MTARQWIDAFADRLGIDPPAQEVVDELLELAGTAAHASERIAAPIACYLVGLARADLATAARLAEEID